jgi:membrane fusion protein (multidrug efflux system)
MYRSSLILAFLCAAFISCKEEEKIKENDKKGAKEGMAMKVNGLIAGETSIAEQLSATGTILANEEVEIKSEVPGKITGIYFKEGSLVTKGQVLVQLNDDDLQAQLKKMAIEIRLQEEKEARQKQLLAASAISKEEYDITKTNLALLKANVDILQTQLDKTRITAPFTGIIGLKSVSPGAFISASTIIVSIQNVNPLKIEFTIPEKYNHLVKPGTVVRFAVAGVSKELTATVYAKEPKIDATTRTTKVRASFPNAGSKIMPGAFADIHIEMGEKTKGIMIPTIAYIPDINGAKLYLCKGGKAVMMPVTAGVRTEKEIQILDGVSPGDTVITSGILQLKPDMPVDVLLMNPPQ